MTVHAAPKQIARDRPGQVIDGVYTLLRELGRGGMAAVWAAERTNGGGQVAIKRILPARRGDEQSVDLFEREARVMCRLNHPNVCRALAFDVDENGDHYMVMELLDGVDLEQWIRAYVRRRESTPWRLAVAIIVEALHGLSSAHNMMPFPIVHRDISPSNVRICSNGTVKLLDFGVAHERPKQDGGRFMGKLAYAAPELACGAPPGSSTDLYAMAITLWEMIAGRRMAGPGMTVETVWLRGRTAPRDIPGRDDLPEALRDIINKALANEPSDRFANAAELANALDDMLGATGNRPDFREIAESVNRMTEPVSRPPSRDHTSIRTHTGTSIETPRGERAQPRSPIRRGGGKAYSVPPLVPELLERRLRRSAHLAKSGVAAAKAKQASRRSGVTPRRQRPQGIPSVCPGED